MSDARHAWQPRIEVLSFDLFDTLIDLDLSTLPRVLLDGKGRPSTAGLLYEAAQPLLREAGDDTGFEAFAAALSTSDRALFRAHQGSGRELPTLERFEAFGASIGCEGEHRASLAARLTDAHMGALRATTRTPAAHRPVLEALARRFRLVLCSNFSHSETALGLLEEAGLLPCFEHCVVSDAVGWRKPRPEIFAAVTERMGVGADRVLHIGDNYAADVGGASAAGMRTAWLTRRVSDREAALARAPDARPDLEIAEIEELEALA